MNSEGVKWVALHSACSEGVGIHTDAQASMHEHWQQPMCRCHSCGVQSPCCCCCCCWEEEDDEEEEGVGAAGGFCFFTALAVCGRRRVQAEVRVCCVMCCVVCGNEAEGERDLHCSPLLEEEEEERGGDTSAAANNNTSGGRGRRRVCVHVWCDCM